MQVDSLVGNLIPNAITASSNVMDEANKFAWGLGVISLVLLGIRFAGTHHRSDADQVRTITIRAARAFTSIRQMLFICAHTGFLRSVS